MGASVRGARPGACREPAGSSNWSSRCVVRRTLREQINILHAGRLRVVRATAMCRRLMTVPGVVLVALTYRATVDVPTGTQGGRGSVRSAPASINLVRSTGPARYRGAATGVQAMLYEAAHTMLVRVAKWSWHKAWAMKIARHRGMKKAIVALAPRLAVLHRIWVDGSEFQWTGTSRGSALTTEKDQDPMGRGARAPPRGGMMSLAGRG